MRVAVVDIGTNSARLLIAEVDGRVTEVVRRATVTGLGEGVDRTGRLGDAPQARTFAVLDDYSAAIDAHAAERRVAVMTSAVRDAANGAAFADRVRRDYRLEARTLSGDEEARLTFLGATTARDRDDPTELLVVDIGGGSTELVVGARGSVDFHVSTQNGVVRHSERHLHSDPPTIAERESLARDVRADLELRVPAEVRARAQAAVAVAGTATSCAAIDLVLDPYDVDRVEGHVLPVPRLDALLERLAALPLAQRRAVTGLQPARAPTIVAGVIILQQVLAAFGLDRTEVSERDILWGVALTSTSTP